MPATRFSAVSYPLRLYSGEGALASWKVFIDANKNGILDTGEATAITDASGAYRFGGIAPGTYRVREVVNAGWRRTTRP